MKADPAEEAKLILRLAIADRKFREHLEQMREVEPLIRPECAIADAGYPASRACVRAALSGEPCTLHSES